jgi:heterodisulfide reductase subunit A-like polyferredoxin
MLKGHHVAMVDFDVCNGCNICVQRCQFGALKMNVTLDKANIDQMRCFGCGLCETACPRGAISLVAKSEIPALREVW